MSGVPDGRSVVAGVDGSRSSGASARVAARVAAGRSAPLRLVMALPTTAGDQLPAPEGLDGRAVLRVAGELVFDALEAETARDLPGLPITSALMEGTAPEVLVAESSAAQLVCVGTTSTGGLGDVLLGSTAGALARRALCPVLVVPLRLTASVSEPSGVVVGLAGSDGDDALLAFALREAAGLGSSVVAVHTWQHSVPGPLRLALEPLVDEVTAQHREEGLVADVVDRGGPLPAPVRWVVRRGGAAETLLAAGLTAELLVVGHRRGHGGHLRSVMSAVLHRATCPVAVVPLGVPVTAAAG